MSTTLAASIAYTVAQGLGKSFAQQLIDKEVGDTLGKKDNAAQRVNSCTTPEQSLKTFRIEILCVDGAQSWTCTCCQACSCMMF